MRARIKPLLGPLAQYLKRQPRYWLTAAIIGTLLFVFAQPVLAKLAGEPGQQGQTRDSGASKLMLGTETVDGFQQVYYLQGNLQVFVTRDQANHINPAGHGDYIVWVKLVDGAGQIERYHIPTATTVQLTRSGSNQNPRSYGNMVAWERWVDGRWQIYFFDGAVTKQITSGDVAVNPDINAKFIVYGRQDNKGAWRAERYDIASGRVEKLDSSGVDAIRPRL